MKPEPYIRLAEGSRYAVLMIHGIVGTPAHFKDLIPAIPDHWSIHNILLDGHGGQAEDFSHSSMAKWKLQVQQQLDDILQTHQQVLIIAHSMGTLFAIREAIRQPEKICGLFLLNVPLSPFVRPSTALNSLFLALGKPRRTPSAQAMEADCGVILTPMLWKYLGWIPRFWELLTEVRSIKKILFQLKVPTLAFQSRLDELVHFHSCKYLQDHPYITTAVLETSGHFAYSPEDTALLLRQLNNTIGSVK